MPWLTVADSTNKVIDESRSIWQTRSLLYGTVIQQRQASRTVVRYVGVARESAADLCATLKETVGTKDCYFAENSDGSATIHHTVETPAGNWENVT